MDGLKVYLISPRYNELSVQASSYTWNMRAHFAQARSRMRQAGRTLSNFVRLGCHQHWGCSISETPRVVYRRIWWCLYLWCVCIYGVSVYGVSIRVGARLFNSPASRPGKLWKTIDRPQSATFFPHHLPPPLSLIRRLFFLLGKLFSSEIFLAALHTPKFFFRPRTPNVSPTVAFLNLNFDRTFERSFLALPC